LSAEENWLAAERALRQKPWRPWVIHFSGEKERSGWDWADLLLKVSVPVLILFLSTAYSFISAERQARTAKTEMKRQRALVIEQSESLAVSSYIKEMQTLLIEKQLRLSAPLSEARAVARGLTLAALSQVKDSQRKRLIIRFLLDSGLNDIPGGLISLSESSLRGADLKGANLRMANFSNADLSEAKLEGADLRGAIFSLATLDETNFTAADLRGVSFTQNFLLKTDFFKADLRGANFRGAPARKASFLGADLRGANFSKAVLFKPDFEKADLRGANLSGTQLFKADFRDADLRGADLRGAVLESIKWNSSTLWPDTTKFEGAKDIPDALTKHLKL
jgi:uncharacterized protein YjbI with pentapeptide repeats